MSLTRNRLTALPLIALLVMAMSLALGTVTLAAQGDPDCPLEPLMLPLFDATPAEVIAATPAVSVDAPEPTEEEIREAAEIIVACSGSTEQAIRFAIFTDRILASQFIGEDTADQPAFERMIATGSAPEEWMFELEGISDVEPLADGRVAVTLHIASPEESVMDRVVLAWDDEANAWLIDGFEWLSSPATPEG